MEHIIGLWRFLKFRLLKNLFFFPKSSLRDWPYIVMAWFCASKRKTTALKIILSLLFLSLKWQSKNNILITLLPFVWAKFSFLSQFCPKRPKDKHGIIFVFWSARRFICSSSRLEDELYLNMLSRPKLRVPCTMYNLVRVMKRSTFWLSKWQSQDEYNYKQLEVLLRFAMKRLRIDPGWNPGILKTSHCN